jgi:Mrp family chromosome partitioning ATPase
MAAVTDRQVLEALGAVAEPARGSATIAANLALGYAANGLAVGVLDADIYGPSMPRMLGTSGRPRSPDGKRLTPMENYGLKAEFGTSPTICSPP